ARLERGAGDPDDDPGALQGRLVLARGNLPPATSAAGLREVL
ncbi:MAG: hypothetical protein JWO60_1140, partial [Frankiales bacterium]|nr:hypothetical protein [Frankiales bacterium]